MTPPKIMNYRYKHGSLAPLTYTTHEMSVKCQKDDAGGAAGVMRGPVGVIRASELTGSKEFDGGAY